MENRNTKYVFRSKGFEILINPFFKIKEIRYFIIKFDNNVNRTSFTTKDRRSIHSYFCTAEQPQQIDQRKYITNETRARIGIAGQKILDIL